MKKISSATFRKSGSFAQVSILLFTVLLSQNALSRGAEDQLTICTITLNSKNEKETFKKHAPPDTRFIELTSFSPVPVNSDQPIEEADKVEWFHRACLASQSKNHPFKCNAIIVSGHFAEVFFGDRTQLELDMDTMEKHSCMKDCENILRSPEEVFLFGCNTLSGKTRDQRTNEDYYNVLVDHYNYSGAFAERLVQSRYGKAFETNQLRMRSIFARVPHVYGFDSTSPKGPDIEASLDQFFKNKPDYYQSLANSAVQRMVQNLDFLNSFSKQIRPNMALKKALKRWSLTECSGIFPGEPEDQDRNYFCQMVNDNIPIANRLRIMNAAISKNLFRFYNIVDQFLEAYPPETFDAESMQAFQEVKGNLAAKRQYLEVLRDKDLDVGFIKANLIALGRNLQWLSPIEVQRETESFVKRYFTRTRPPLSEDSHELLTFLASVNPDFIIREDLLPRDWRSNPMVISAISRFRNIDFSLQNSLLDVMNTTTSDEAFNKAVRALKYVSILDRDVFNALKRYFRDPNTNPGLKQAAISILRKEVQRRQQGVQPGGVQMPVSPGRPVPPQTVPVPVPAPIPVPIPAPVQGGYPDRVPLLEPVYPPAYPPYQPPIGEHPTSSGQINAYDLY